MELSTSPDNSAAAAANRVVDENAGRLIGEDDRLRAEEGDRFSIGNRWPRQETLALLEIRSEMDTAFREAGLKAPLWEEVSRKLSEFGYNRSAKKCKEKFENVFKYHRRTKEGRSGKASGKSYRFFEQLEALDSNHGLLSPFSPDKVSTPMATTSTVCPSNVVINAVPTSIHTPSVNFMDNPSTSATSTSSEESEGMRKKKRKLTRFFERLINEVIEKQESLQRNFLDAIEKCEQERMAREEAWKMQELDRIKRERELLLEERSIAAAKDAAVLSFLQKLSEQNSSVVQLPKNQIVHVQMPELQIVPVEKVVKEQENNNLESFVNMSSSRWPKEEIETLIKLRTNLDMQYQDNGPKGPLWEEVSAAMKKHGYNRNAKRCKEKWENMNKYFKRVRENNKRRPDDAKTCPYFHQLDALYREKKTRKVDNSVNTGKELKPEELLMHMMGGQEERQRQEFITTEDGESENADQNQEDDRENDEEDEYRVVASDPSSAAIMDRLEMH